MVAIWLRMLTKVLWVVLVVKVTGETEETDEALIRVKAGSYTHGRFR